MIKQAVILSAGLGSRLRPYTDTMPKPMISILGKPLLEWDVEQFKKYGVTEFFFNLHYLPDVIRDHFGDGSKWGVSIHYHVEPEILGTAGALRAFEGELDSQFFLIYGDTFSLVDYGKMENAYFKMNDPIGMQRMERADEYGDADVAELDASGRFIAVHGKPHEKKYPNAYRMRGVFILDKRILAYMPKEGAYQLGSQLISDAIAAGKNFYAYECDDYSKGIDTIDKWKEVEDHLRKSVVS